MVMALAGNKSDLLDARKVSAEVINASVSLVTFDRTKPLGELQCT